MSHRGDVAQIRCAAPGLDFVRATRHPAAVVTAVPSHSKRRSLGPEDCQMWGLFWCKKQQIQAGFQLLRDYPSHAGAKYTMR
ncbi:hypothetical protein TM1040_1080 [Ruegeria sp. TM1040]|nr:hypothetical protein TM1040_1080 [Ruegeria sp. TM1040]